MFWEVKIAAEVGPVFPPLIWSWFIVHLCNLFLPPPNNPCIYNSVICSVVIFNNLASIAFCGPGFQGPSWAMEFFPICSKRQGQQMKKNITIWLFSSKAKASQLRNVLQCPSPGTSYPTTIEVSSADKLWWFKNAGLRAIGNGQQVLLALPLMPRSRTILEDE